jgi:hypothetical protein
VVQGLPLAVDGPSAVEEINPYGTEMFAAMFSKFLHWSYMGQIHYFPHIFVTIFMRNFNIIL